MRPRSRAILAMACLAAPAGLFQACRAKRAATRPAASARSVAAWAAQASTAPADPTSRPTRPPAAPTQARVNAWPMFRGNPTLSGSARGTLPDDLTPTEVQVIHLIRQGKKTKEIAQCLNIATSTIDFHRNNIRKKIGLTHHRTSLQTHFLSTLS